MSFRAISNRRARRRRRTRGATFTEYALVLAMLSTATIGGIEALTTESNDLLVETGDQIGAPRLRRDEISRMTVSPPPSWIVGTDPPSTDPPATDPPATDPPATDPPVTVRPAMTNLAVDGTADSSSVGWGGVPSRAIDGNTDGNYNHGSVTHSALGSNGNGQREWVSIDLGQDDNLLDNIVIWNRTNCCSERLRDVYIVVSDNPITGSSLAEAQASGGASSFFMGDGPFGASTTVAVNRTGRYVRVFGADDQYLHLAEIVVNGQGPGE